MVKQYWKTGMQNEEFRIQWPEDCRRGLGLGRAVACVRKSREGAWGGFGLRVFGFGLGRAEPVAGTKGPRTIGPKTDLLLSGTPRARTERGCGDFRSFSSFTYFTSKPSGRRDAARPLFARSSFAGRGYIPPASGGFRGIAGEIFPGTGFGDTEGTEVNTEATEAGEVL